MILVVLVVQGDVGRFGRCMLCTFVDAGSVPSSVRTC